jgi:hypothetical protein
MDQELAEELSMAQTPDEVNEALEDLYGYAHFLMIMGFLTGYERRVIRNKDEVTEFMKYLHDKVELEYNEERIERGLNGADRFGKQITNERGVAQQERWLKVAHERLNQSEGENER